MSKKNLVLALIISFIPTTAFAATITETTMIPTHYIYVAFTFAVLIGIRFLFEDWMNKRQIAKLKEELQLAQENHRRNGDIAREYQLLCGELQETAALNAEAFKEVSRDAREAWQEVESLRARVAFLEISAANGWKDAGEKFQEIIDLKAKVQDLEDWIASPPPVPTSKPAFGPENDIW